MGDGTTITVTSLDYIKAGGELGIYFVQRRRIDIYGWEEQSLFLSRKTKETAYTLSSRWDAFFEKVRSYCFDLAQKAEKGPGQVDGPW